VDGNGLVFHLFERKVEQSGYPFDSSVCPSYVVCQHKQLVSSLVSFITMLQSTSSRVIVVFDGPVLADKTSRYWTYREELLDGVWSGVETAPISIHSPVLKKKRFPLPLLTEEVVMDTLKSLGVQLLFSTRQENDLLLSSLSLTTDSLVLAEDSDFMLMETAGYVPFSSLELQSEGLMGTIYTRDSVCEKLGISSNRVAAFATLAGNDFFHPHEQKLSLSAIIELIKRTPDTVSNLDLVLSAVGQSQPSDDMRSSLARYSLNCHSPMATFENLPQATQEICTQGRLCNALIGVLDRHEYWMPIALGLVWDKTVIDFLLPVRKYLYQRVFAQFAPLQLNGANLSVVEHGWRFDAAGKPSLHDSQVLIPQESLNKPFALSGDEEKQLVELGSQHRLFVESIRHLASFFKASAEPEATVILKALIFCYSLCSGSRGALASSFPIGSLSPVTAFESKFTIVESAFLFIVSLWRMCDNVQQVAQPGSNANNSASVPIHRLINGDVLHACWHLLQHATAEQAAEILFIFHPDERLVCFRLCKLMGFPLADEAKSVSSLPPNLSPLLEVQNAAQSTTVTSALVLIPPMSCWNSIQPWRRDFDPSYYRWYPHLNLLYPFHDKKLVRIHSLPDLIEAKLESFEPFTITLDQVELFEHKRSFTLVVRPCAKSVVSLTRLQSALQDLFPICTHLAERGDHGYNPHLTLGSFAARESAMATLEVVKRSWQPLSWTVDSLHIISRDEDSADSKEESVLEREQGRKGGVFMIDRKVLLGMRSARPWPRSDTQMIDYSNATREASSGPSSNGPNGKITGAQVIRVPLSQLIGGKKLETAPAYRFSQELDLWKPLSTVELAKSATPQADALKVTTYNVLCDEYCTESILSEQRLPLISKILHQEDADIIALQEVTPVFMRFLLDQSWVRSSYFVTESLGCEGLDPFGVVILSRFPFVHHRLKLSRYKVAPIAQIPLNGRCLVVCAVHLTSNHSGNMNQRMLQLETVYKLFDEKSTCSETEDCLVLGDFNFGDSEDGDEFALGDEYRDCWKDLRPNEAGFTFDGKTNRLASITGPASTSRRLDRIILNPKNKWVAKSIDRIGLVPFHVATEDKEGQLLFASDHYGVSAKLSFGQSEKEKCAVEVKQIQMPLVPKSPLPALPAALFPVVRSNVAESVQRLVDKLLQPLAQGSDDIEPMLIKTYIVGSHALQLDSSDSDVDLLCVGELDMKSFFSELTKRVMGSRDGLVVNRYISADDALVPIVKCTYTRNGESTFVDIQYALVQQTVDKWFDPRALSAAQVRKMSVASALAVNALRDIDCILKSGMNMDKFRTVSRCIRLWAKRQ